MISLDPSDLERLLLGGAPGSSAGGYDHDRWSVFLPTGRSSEENRYTSLHESLHEDLSASTAYGAILHAVAYLARGADEEWMETRYRNLLRDLVCRCRTTHECFATYLGLLLIGEATGERLLLAYPDYQRFVRIGRQLSSGLSGGYLR